MEKERLDGEDIDVFERITVSVSKPHRLFDRRSQILRTTLRTSGTPQSCKKLSGMRQSGVTSVGVLPLKINSWAPGQAPVSSGYVRFENTAIDASPA